MQIACGVWWGGYLLQPGKSWRMCSWRGALTLYVHSSCHPYYRVCERLLWGDDYSFSSYWGIPCWRGDVDAYQSTPMRGGPPVRLDACTAFLFLTSVGRSTRQVLGSRIDQARLDPTRKRKSYREDKSDLLPRIPKIFGTCGGPQKKNWLFVHGRLCTWLKDN